MGNNYGKNILENSVYNSLEEWDKLSIQNAKTDDEYIQALKNIISSRGINIDKIINPSREIIIAHYQSMPVLQYYYWCHAQYLQKLDHIDIVEILKIHPGMYENIKISLKKPNYVDSVSEILKNDPSTYKKINFSLTESECVDIIKRNINMVYHINYVTNTIFYTVINSDKITGDIVETLLFKTPPIFWDNNLEAPIQLLDVIIQRHITCGLTRLYNEISKKELSNNTIIKLCKIDYRIIQHLLISLNDADLIEIINYNPMAYLGVPHEKQTKEFIEKIPPCQIIEHPHSINLNLLEFDTLLSCAMSKPSILSLVNNHIINQIPASWIIICHDYWYNNGTEQTIIQQYIHIIANFKNIKQLVKKYHRLVGYYRNCSSLDFTTEHINNILNFDPKLILSWYDIDTHPNKNDIIDNAIKSNIDNIVVLSRKFKYDIFRKGAIYTALNRSTDWMFWSTSLHRITLECDQIIHQFKGSVFALIFEIIDNNLVKDLRGIILRSIIDIDVKRAMCLRSKILCYLKN